MDAGEKVTVDKSYFDALLRRADFHTSAQILERRNVPKVTVSREHYDYLSRASREYDLLKTQLLQGGLSHEALESLTSGADDADNHQHESDAGHDWADDVPESPYTHRHRDENADIYRRHAGTPSGYGSGPRNYGLTAGQASTHHTNHTSTPAKLRTSASHHNVSNGPPPSYLPDESFGDSDSLLDEESPNEVFRNGTDNDSTQRTLYFTGFPSRTTYQDLISVIKGGKLLSINLRSEKSATVTFLDSAADYLAWAKRNDVYILSKRIEVRWAERQFRLNNHIANKIANGATRNIRIRGAVERGLTETGIRNDMEHIHNLIVISVIFRKGDAYVSTNSVHNALFARTCMMSRSTYKGCKIEFFPDECDAPLPVRGGQVKVGSQQPAVRKASLANRFDMLDIDGASDAENVPP